MKRKLGTNSLLRIEGFALAAVLLVLYGLDIVQTISTCFVDENFSHGLVVPLLSALLIWKRRAIFHNYTWTPSWTGLLVIVEGLALRVFAELAAELFFLRLSFIIILVGISLCVFGFPITKRLIGPIGLLLFMIPLPYVVYQDITLPLKAISTNVAVAVFNTIGMPAFKMGNIIELEHLTMNMDSACSGLRYLLPFIVLAIFWGQLTVKSWYIRTTLIAEAAVLSIIANICRIICTGVLFKIGGSGWIVGWPHTLLGIVVVLFAGLLFMLSWMFLKEKAAPALIESSSGNHTAVSPARAPVFLSGGILLSLLTIFWLQMQNKMDPPELLVNLENFPTQIENWHGFPDSLHNAQNLNRTLFDQSFSGYYYDADSFEVKLVLAYLADYHRERSLHSPKHCFQTAGFAFHSTKTIHFYTHETVPKKITATQMIVERSGLTEVITYLYYTGESFIGSDYLMRFFLLRDALIYNRRNRCLIKLVSVIDEVQDNRVKLHQQFLEACLPYLVHQFYAPPMQS
ncbi:EpsI family protein [candidate division KSB1 bacterium]|nr:EpsI family protein [candidate division KSB1 bacterium]